VIEHRAESDEAFLEGDLVTLEGPVAGASVPVVKEDAQFLMVPAGTHAIVLDRSDAQEGDTPAYRLRLEGGEHSGHVVLSCPGFLRRRRRDASETILRRMGWQVTSGE
jgi:hypothetical protein